MVLVILSGCSEEDLVCPEPESCPEPIPCPTMECPVCQCPTCDEPVIIDNQDSTYVVNLIRQLKDCEKDQGRNWSYIQLHDDWEECNRTLSKIKEDLK